MYCLSCIELHIPPLISYREYIVRIWEQIDGVIIWTAVYWVFPQSVKVIMILSSRYLSLIKPSWTGWPPTAVGGHCIIVLKFWGAYFCLKRALGCGSLSQFLPFVSFPIFLISKQLTYGLIVHVACLHLTGFNAAELLWQILDKIRMWFGGANLYFTKSEKAPNVEIDKLGVITPTLGDPAAQLVTSDVRYTM